MGHELVHHLKPTLPEVERGRIALICIATVCLSLTSLSLRQLRPQLPPPTPPPLAGFIFKGQFSFIPVKWIHPELLISG